MKNQNGFIDIDGKTEDTELIPAGRLKIQDLFIEQKGLNKLIEDIKKKAYSYGQDATTDDGRAIIRSTAFKIARLRTFLKDIGKNFIKNEKERVKKANETIKKIEEMTKKIQEEYRKPLTDYEDAEKIKAEKKAKEHKEKVEGWIRQLQEIKVIVPYQQIALMTDEEFEVLFKNKKEIYDFEQKIKERETALKNINVFRAGATGETLVTTHDDFVFEGQTASWEEISQMTDEDFEIYFHKLNLAIVDFSEKKAKAKAEADAKAEKERKELEDQKAELREQKRNAIILSLTSLGFNCEDNHFTFTIDGNEVVSANMDDLLDLDIEPMKHRINELGERVQLAKDLHEKSKSEKPEPEVDEIEKQIETAEKDMAIDSEEKEESVLSESVKSLIEADITLIHNWIDTMKSIAIARPVFTAKHSDSACEDISTSFVEFLNKAKELVTQELI